MDVVLIIQTIWRGAACTVFRAIRVHVRLPLQRRKAVRMQVKIPAARQWLVNNRQENRCFPRHDVFQYVTTAVGCQGQNLQIVKTHHHRVVYQVSAEARSSSTNAAAPRTSVVTKPQAVQDKLRTLLRRSILFAGLEEEALQDVINAMFEVHVEAGATLIKYAFQRG